MSKIQEALDKIRASSPARQANQVGGAVGMGDRQRPGSLTDGADGAVADIALMHEQGYRSDLELAQARTISPSMDDERILNAMRELRTSVLQRLGTDKRIIMITATDDDGGGSFVSRNLAAAIALDEGKTALVIDCNLKRPDISSLAECQNNPGLRGFLQDTTINPADIICRTGIPRLRIIPSGDGEEESHELFTSNRLRLLLIELKKRYPERYIVLDAPSIASDADVRILLEVCDYVALVVPFGKTTTSKIIESAKLIGKDKFLGLIFNNKPLS